MKIYADKDGKLMYQAATPEEAAGKVHTALAFGGISLGDAEAAVDNITSLVGAKAVRAGVVCGAGRQRAHG